MANKPQIPTLRIRVFVDFWNFSLSVRDVDLAFKIDWNVLGPAIAEEAGKLIDNNMLVTFEGMHVYGSYDPEKPSDSKLRNWATNTLDKMPGVKVVFQPRQKKRNPPKCPACKEEVPICPSCGADMRGSEEKGVDTRIATDMISLAWADGYNTAVLLSADKDFVPVAEFLQTKGIKVIHGSFPPMASQLSQKCWGNLPIPPLMPYFNRALTN